MPTPNWRVWWHVGRDLNAKSGERHRDFDNENDARNFAATKEPRMHPQAMEWGYVEQTRKGS